MAEKVEIKINEGKIMEGNSGENWGIMVIRDD